jgi:hypothetical protein
MHECAFGLYSARYTCCKQLRGERVEAEGVLYYCGYKGLLRKDEGGTEGSETKGLQYQTVRGKERRSSSIMVHQTRILSTSVNLQNSVSARGGIAFLNVHSWKVSGNWLYQNHHINVFFDGILFIFSTLMSFNIHTISHYV